MPILTRAIVIGANGGASTPANGTVNGVVANGQFPQPKTDKPRPHQCTTCGRSFARLEHLKRHERSHTKEKPFECPECTRCFARRDLLLRHQQKLHSTGGATRPRTGRRESVAGTAIAGGDRVRKNSLATLPMSAVAGLAANHARPRANTLGHIDLMHFDPHHHHRMEALGLNVGNGNMAAANGFQQQPMDFDFNGMQHHMPAHPHFTGLPKLDTHMHTGDMSNNLRTAPPTTNFGGFDAEQLFGSNSTINPAALHSGDVVTVPSNMPFGFDPNFAQHVAPGEDFGWMRDWNMQHMNGGHGDDNPEVFEESSPSCISSGDSPADINDSMNNSHATMPPRDFVWPPAEGPAQSNAPLGTPFQLEALGNGFSHLGVMGETVSPSHLHPGNGGETYFPQQPMLQVNGHGSAHPHMNQQGHHAPPQQHQQQQHQQQQQQDMMNHQGAAVFGHPLTQFDSNTPSIAASSMTGSVSARQSSATTLSTDSITESTRQALLNTLSQPSVYGGHLYRKYSQPSVSSPLSGGGRPTSQPAGPNLPSTADIRRYIDAYVQYTHPHLPVIHYPTLSFESIANIQSSSPGNDPTNPTIGGAKCLILSMAAIGALYEYDHPASKELFDAGKKMIALYLEEKRKSDMAKRQNRAAAAEPEQPPPLWLVQAILLNVIYGHHCGERLAAEVASQHISSLIGLMRAAKVSQTTAADGDEDVDMAMNGMGVDDNPLTRHTMQEEYLHRQWMKWKVKEERKRCFYAMFFVSSLLMIGYNQTPAIMNSEIKLTLPCDDELYNAESAQEWHARGGLAAAEAQEIPFAQALGMLLSADQRQPPPTGAPQDPSPLGSLQAGDHFESELRPSTYGCLILIVALHNFIWETRARHGDGEWTPQQRDALVHHVEPALKAWQAAWKSNPHHRIERPNPFGLGPLSADCIPLLDLAFVRLYVDMGPAVEAFWTRDFERMVLELFKEKTTTAMDADGSAPAPMSPDSRTAATSHRERHLRKAAFYAADSLSIACQYNLTYADQTAHELPIQAAICFLDCVHVLSQWIAAVQTRVGPQLGVLGRAPCTLDVLEAAAAASSSSPPPAGGATNHVALAARLLTHEDFTLLRKIADICHRLEQKRLAHETLLAVEINNFNPAHDGAVVDPLRNEVDLSGYGFAGKVARVTSMMLEKAVIWPSKFAT